MPPLDSLLGVGLLMAGLVAGAVVVLAVLRLRRPEGLIPTAHGAIVEAMPDCIIVLDDEDRILDLNPAAERLMGRSLEDAAGKRVGDAWRLWRDRIEGQLGRSEGGREVTLDAGDRRTYHVRSSGLADWQGTSTNRVIVLRDISELKRAEDEARRRGDELSALLDTAQALASSLELEEVLETIARKAKLLTGAQGSQIHLFQPDGRTLKTLVVISDFADVVVAGPVSVGEGVIGRVAATGEAEIVNRAELEGASLGLPASEWEGQRLMCTPLAVKDKVTGVMTLSRSGDEDFREKDLRLFTSLASQAAAAIENARLYEETRRLAVTDPLTGVWNRRHVEERLQVEADRAHRFRHPLSVLVVDIDGLKLFNDTYGHTTGDEVICRAARVIQASCREVDVVGRYGGDEFAVILPETDSAGAAAAAQRFLQAVDEEPFQLPSGGKVPIKISIGAASYPADTGNALRLFYLADTSMYKAKMAGGGQFASVTSVTDEVRAELADSYDALKGLLLAVDAKDRYTFRHSQQVTEQALALAGKLDLSVQELEALEVACRLHDVGKIGVPSNVLRKPGGLNIEEWRVIHEHPSLGTVILQQIPDMELVSPAVLHHHERYDGMGYPSGLRGEDIPRLARILAVADAFAAMVADRPYRKALTVQEACDELRSEAGKQFDPRMVEEFIEAIQEAAESEGQAPRATRAGALGI